MLFRVLPRGVVLVLGGFQVMTKCNSGVVRGLLVIAGFVMLGGFAMMFSSLLIMFRCSLVVFVNLVLRHFSLLALAFQPTSYAAKRSKGY
jgi:hypothetical protein